MATCVSAKKNYLLSQKIDKEYNLLYRSIAASTGLVSIYLKENNIYSQIHYIPAHLMPYYRSLGWKEGDLPISENYYKHCLSLPMYPSLSDPELNFVIDKVLEFYR